MRPPERIETARLNLRLPTMADAAPIFAAYARDPTLATLQPAHFISTILRLSTVSPICKRIR